MQTFGDIVKAARLSFSDLEWLSNGVLTQNKLKRHSAGLQSLSQADLDLVETILARHAADTTGIKMLVLSKVKARAGAHAVSAMASK